MEWTRGPIIGRGSTATVSLANLASSGEFIAVKSTELSRSMFLQREQCFLSKISSPYVVNYIGFSVTNENNKPMYNLCMEYMPRGTLYDEIQRHGGRLDEQMIKLYTWQILQGLNHLHMNGMAHCDIKSNNVLIGNDGAKIADLGCAKYVAEIDGNACFATSAFSGTPVFMAPEVARREEQGLAADIWAVGCTIVEMATGTNPWPKLNDPVSALYQIGFSGESPEIPRWLSREAKDFLSKCLRGDPKERLKAKELLEHPFVCGVEFDPFKNVEKFIMSSPCTVLDHGFWDSLEEAESSENLSLKASPPPSSSSSSNSAVKRIQQLIGCALPSSASSVPNWSLDEDWITVRSYGIEETKICSDENDLIIANESSAESTLVWDLISEEEVQNSTFMEDLFPGFSIDSNSDISNVGIRRDILLPFDIVRDNFVSENLDFETNNGKSSFVQFPSLFSLQSKHVYIFFNYNLSGLISTNEAQQLIVDIDFYSVPNSNDDFVQKSSNHRCWFRLLCVNGVDFLRYDKLVQVNVGFL